VRHPHMSVCVIHTRASVSLYLTLEVCGYRFSIKLIKYSSEETYPQKENTTSFVALRIYICVTKFNNQKDKMQRQFRLTIKYIK